MYYMNLVYKCPHTLIQAKHDETMLPVCTALTQAAGPPNSTVPVIGTD